MAATWASTVRTLMTSRSLNLDCRVRQHEAPRGGGVGQPFGEQLQDFRRVPIGGPSRAVGHVRPGREALGDIGVDHLSVLCPATTRAESPTSSACSRLPARQQVRAPGRVFVSRPDQPPAAHRNPYE